ncbi:MULTISPECIES: hypothetical protein [unclassified Bradyrhizobium]|uniref:hypothetical protein n=1 Tax=unclassified Bradyrhizobium TaxID=2631580 RepID=UPI0024E0DF4D|nr:MULTISPECIES: hypothetical protein [unclassified Bradyrhizobium]
MLVITLARRHDGTASAGGNCLSGKSRKSENTCQWLPKNINRFSPSPNQQYGPRIPLRGRGRFAVVTDVGSGMRWTRAGGVL